MMVNAHQIEEGKTTIGHNAVMNHAKRITPLFTPVKKGTSKIMIMTLGNGKV